MKLNFKTFFFSWLLNSGLTEINPRKGFLKIRCEREGAKEILIEEGIKKIASCLFASTLIPWWNDFPDARSREMNEAKARNFFFSFSPFFKMQLGAQKIKRRVNHDLWKAGEAYTAACAAGTRGGAKIKGKELRGTRRHFHDDFCFPLIAWLVAFPASYLDSFDHLHFRLRPFVSPCDPRAFKKIACLLQIRRPWMQWLPF